MKLGMKGIGMGAIRSIKQSRRWCWQDKDTIELIRKNFKGQRLTTALAIYLTLTELASNQGTDEFSAYYSQITTFSGKSFSTVRNYCSEFIKLGITDKKNKKVNDKTNLANQWSLLAPSVNNNYQTSIKDNYPTSVKYNYQLLEENELEEINKNGVKKLGESEGYKKLRERVEQLRGGESW